MMCNISICVQRRRDIDTNGVTLSHLVWFLKRIFYIFLAELYIFDLTIRKLSQFASNA